MSGRAAYSLKTRLYLIIAFLGLLPVIGVALALLAIHVSQDDGVALDRAASGTIHLERVNGLVYAVVMKSRGIYMSADWKTAEPFAKNLAHQLGELQDVARRGEATPSPRSNPMSKASPSGLTSSCASVPSLPGLHRKRVRRPLEPSETTTPTGPLGPH